jgi:3-phosphoshikimate 1-carboxyvinyltransferase
MFDMKISPASGIRGRIVLPGDKSISHRAAIMLSLSDGAASIANFATSADCWATVNCLRPLGVGIDKEDGLLRVHGVGKDGLSEPKVPLNCENSGTTMRLMSGVLAGQPFTSVLTGDESLQRRPMRRVIEPLNSMGASVEGTDGRAPLTISGRRPLKPIDLVPSAASAQLKSCILLAGLNANGRTSVLESTPTRDHTERMLRWLGVDVAEEPEAEGLRISVSGDSRPTAKDIEVPGDISSAAFFLAAAGFLQGSHLELPAVGVNGSRRAVIDVLCEMGAEIAISGERERCNEPIADLLVRGIDPAGRARPLTLSGPIIANLIDEIPVLAVAATQAGGLEIRDAAELRVKESDRISVVVENLRRMGADVEELPDGMIVRPSRLTAAKIESFGDHRIAMAFAVAGLFAEGDTEIEGAECAAVSFPGFFDSLRSVIY